MIFHVFTSRSVSFHRAMVISQTRWRYLSDHDPLTGLLNARSFARQGEQLVQLTQRQGATYSVLVIDLDHFKRVNDEHGHDAGDAVLRAVASASGRRLRRTDRLGRLGGEEFVAFLPATAKDGAMQVAEALRDDIQSLALSGPLG